MSGTGIARPAQASNTCAPWPSSPARKAGETGRSGGEAADPGAREGGALSLQPDRVTTACS